MYFSVVKIIKKENNDQILKQSSKFETLKQKFNESKCFQWHQNDSSDRKRKNSN